MGTLRNFTRIVICCALWLSTSLSLLGNRNPEESASFQLLAKLTQYNGLSSPKVNSIIKDCNGFIWIGTNNGINRYDSKSIKNYYLANQALGSDLNIIYCLFQSSDNTIWAGTKYGIFKYNSKKDVFEKDNLTIETELNNIQIFDIIEDNSGTVWFGTGNGIFEFRNNSYFKTEILDSKIITGPVKLAFDSSGILWIGNAANGVFLWNPKTKQSNPFICINDSEINSKLTQIQNILFGPDGNLWVGTWGNGLWKLNLKDKTCKVYKHEASNTNSPNSDYIKSIAFDPESRLWIGYEEAGLDYFFPDRELFNHFYAPISKNSLFEEPSIYEIFIDSDMIMWLGFRNDGVQAFSLSENPFKHFTNPKDSVAYQVFCLLEIQDNYLVAGVKGALDVVNTKNGTFQRFKLPNNETPVSMATFNNQQIIIATYNNNVYSFNYQTRQFQTLFDQNKSRPDVYLEKLRLVHYIQGKDYFLLGTENGLFKIPLHKNQVIEKIVNQWIHKIIDNGDNKHYWLSPYNNVFTMINMETYETATFNFDISKDTKAFAKHQDLIFIGTDLGLFKIDLKTSNTHEFKGIFPYANVQVNAIEKDNISGIWCSSFENIIHYDLIDEQFRSYDKSDNLPNVRFRDGVSCKLKNGRIAFGGQGGIIILDPNSLKKQKNNSKIELTNLKIQNQTINPNDENSPIKENIATINHLILKNNQNNFSLEFSLLCYINPSKHRFNYKIEGLNNEWIDLGNQNQITFNNLKTGKYKLLIKATNQDNQWSTEKQLIVEILPPFYQTWYAFLVYLAILTALFLLFFKAYKARERIKNDMRTNELKLQNIQRLVNQENEFHQMKLQFFTNISHELRTPISLIIAPLEKYFSSDALPDRQSLDLMHKNAERLNRLVTQILDFRKMEAGKLKLELSKGDFSDFCKRKAILFLPLAQKKNLKYFIDTPSDTKQIWFDDDKMEKIIYNLLSNAFKFTKKGKVTFSLKFNNESDDQFAVITVADTGRGISAADAEHLFERFHSPNYPNDSDLSYEKGTGIGLSLAKEMVEIHQGEISYHPVEGGGSEFIVKIPLNILPEEDAIASQNHSFIKKEDNLPSRNSLTKFYEEGQEKPKILFIDDNEDLRTFIQQEFNADFSVLLAENGLEGMKLAGEEMPDIIISDFMMPGLDGIQMCEMIRNNASTSHIPLIILTAQESTSTRIKCFKSGIDDYITKPFSTEVLLLKVKNILQSRRELQKKFSKEIRLEPTELAITNTDEAFLNKVMEIIQENLSNEDFSADFFAEKMAMSRVHLYRKLKSLTGESVSDFVKTIRLKLAADLIKNKNVSVKETTYLVGFSDPKYFSKCFKQQFGVKPTEYAKQNNN